MLHRNCDRENMKAESILCRKHGNRTQDLWLTMPLTKEICDNTNTWTCNSHNMKYFLLGKIKIHQHSYNIKKFNKIVLNYKMAQRY